MINSLVHISIPIPLILMEKKDYGPNIYCPCSHTYPSNCVMSFTCSISIPTHFFCPLSFSFPCHGMVIHISTTWYIGLVLWVIFTYAWQSYRDTFPDYQEMVNEGRNKMSCFCPFCPYCLTAKRRMKGALEYLAPTAYSAYFCLTVRRLYMSSKARNCSRKRRAICFTSYLVEVSNFMAHPRDTF